MKMRKILSLIVAPLFVVGMAACDVEQTEEGELPDVDIEGGQVPEYDVDAADIEIGTDTTQVITPDIDVQSPDADGD